MFNQSTARKVAFELSEDSKSLTLTNMLAQTGVVKDKEALYNELKGYIDIVYSDINQRHKTVNRIRNANSLIYYITSRRNTQYDGYRRCFHAPWSNLYIPKRF